MATGKRDIVWVADRVNAQFQADLGPKLDALDAEYDDDITLEDVPFGHYHVAEQLRMNDWPSIATIPEETDPHGDGDNFDRYGIEDHSLTVAFAHTLNETEDQLKRRTGRYVRAIAEVLLDNSTLNGSVVDVSVIGKSLGPMQHREDSLLQEGQVRIRVQTTA